MKKLEKEYGYKLDSLPPQHLATIDHVESLYLGGEDEEVNLVPCCKSCNSRKGWRRK